MNWIKGILTNHNVGYSKLHQVSHEVSTSSSFRHLTNIFGLVFNKAVIYSPLALLPTLLIFHTDFATTRISALLLGMLTVLLFVAILYKIQDRLLYHPSMPENSRFYVPFPSAVIYEIVSLETADHELLHGYLLKQPDEKMKTVPTLIYFHGNAGNAGSPCVLPLYALCGVNVLVVDYRGYGKSSGYPSEEGLYIDGRTCIEYLQSRGDVDPNKIVLFGHSMGGAVAIHLAALMQESRYRIAALILENTFTSIPEVAKHIFRSVVPGISKLPLLCYKNKFLSIEKIDTVTVPILFISGEKDEILNPEMTRRLMNASRNSHTVLLSIPNGSHNDTWCTSHAYHKCISSFLRKVFNEDMQKHGSQSADDTDENEMTISWRTEIVGN